MLPCSARAVAQQQLYAFCAPSLGVRPLPRRVCASMCPSRMRSCLSIQISPPGLPPNGARGPTLPLCDGTMPTLPTKFLHCPEEYLHCPQKLISFLNCLFSVVDTCTAPIFYRNNLHCPVWVVNTCTAPGGGKKQPVLPISLKRIKIKILHVFLGVASACEWQKPAAWRQSSRRPRAVGAACISSATLLGLCRARQA